MAWTTIPPGATRAGVNANTGKMGKVANDDRADWREAWALFPGEVAYVWHAGRFASTVQDSLEACGFAIRAQIVWGKDRFALSRGHYHWQHEPCWYAVRGLGRTGAATARNRRCGAFPPRGCRARARHAKAGGVHAPADGEQLLARPGGLRAVLRLRHHHHRRGDDRPRLPCASRSIPAYVDVAVTRWQDFTGEAATLEATARASPRWRRSGRWCRHVQRGQKTAGAGPKVVVGGFAQRAEPPEDLVPEAEAIWRLVVSSEPTDFISTAATRDLLKDYCRHRTTADKVSAIIDLFQADWLKSKDGVKRYSDLCKVRDAEGRAAADKATKLRLTNQSRYQPSPAARAGAKALKGQMPWDE